MLEIGIQAPDFTLCNEENETIALSNFKGKKVVIYFYPKDSTPGCTKQACAFKSVYDDFRAADIVVIGISKDNSASHKRFKDTYELPFVLLCDPELSVIQAYDVWKEKKLFGKTYMGVTRSTYILDEDGKIIKTFEKASPANNATDILKFIKTLS